MDCGVRSQVIAFGGPYRFTVFRAHLWQKTPPILKWYSTILTVTRIYIYIYIYIYVYYVYIDVYIYIDVHIYVSMIIEYMYVYVYVYVYDYIYRYILPTPTPDPNTVPTQPVYPFFRLKAWQALGAQHAQQHRPPLPTRLGDALWRSWVWSLVVRGFSWIVFPKTTSHTSHTSHRCRSLKPGNYPGRIILQSVTCWKHSPIILFGRRYKSMSELDGCHQNELMAENAFGQPKWTFKQHPQKYYDQVLKHQTSDAKDWSQVSHWIQLDCICLHLLACLL